MGIQGLLQALRPISTPVHVRDLAGLRVGVDAYVWLHRGTYACAADLCQGRPTKAYLNSCIQRLRLLIDHGVHVYLVFDGGPLPAKRGTESERRARREENRLKALQLMGQGRSGEAFSYFSKAVDVTPAMARAFIDTIRSGVPNVNYVVAPYEADAQLAFLCKAGAIDAVITEDSDLLAFGCPRVIFKLDQDGQGQQICQADLFRAPVPGLGDMRSWDETIFLAFCILAGCDYLPSIAGVGIASAFRLLARHKTPAKAIRAMRFDGKLRVPHDYEARFQRAFLTFRHQRVYDPAGRALAHVHPLTPELAALPPADVEYLGPSLEDAVAAAIAVGDLDPITLQPFALAAPSTAAPAPQQSRMSDFLARSTSTSSNASGNARSEEAPPAGADGGEGPSPLAPPVEEEGEGAEQLLPRPAGPTVVYRPGLRKSAAPAPPPPQLQQRQQQQQQNRITGYLQRTTTVLSGLLPRKRPAPAPATASVGGSTAAGGGGGDGDVAAAASEAENAGEAAVGCLPQVSGWFRAAAAPSAASAGSKSDGPGHDKENATGAAASASASSSLFSAATTTTRRPGLFQSSSKRQRTLGARAVPSSAFALRRFSGFQRDEEEEGGQMDDEEEEGTGEAAADCGGGGGPKDDVEASPGYGDSLQPPTPGTPFSFTAAPDGEMAQRDDEDEEGALPAAAAGSGSHSLSFRSFERFSYSGGAFGLDGDTDGDGDGGVAATTTTTAITTVTATETQLTATTVMVTTTMAAASAVAASAAATPSAASKRRTRRASPAAAPPAPVPPAAAAAVKGLPAGPEASSSFLSSSSYLDAFRFTSDDADSLLG